jgi:hypothetical protein
MPIGPIEKPDEVIYPIKIGNATRAIRFRRTGDNTWTNVDAITIAYGDLTLGYEDILFGQGQDDG